MRIHVFFPGLIGRLALLIGLITTTVAGADDKPVEPWKYQGGDGEIFERPPPSPRGRRGATRLLVMPELHRDDVEVFRVSSEQSILRVKATDHCLMLFHYSMVGEDDEIGVAVTRFEKGGDPLLTKRGVPTPAPMGVKYLARFLELKRLTLDSPETPPDELKHLAALTKLRRLVIRDVNASETDLVSLSGLSLDSLTLTNCPVTDRLGPTLATLRELRELALIETKIGREGLRQMRAIPLLESLDLSGSSLTTADIGELAQFTALRKLKLKNTGLDDSSIEALAKLIVQELSIEGTQITPTGMARLWDSRPAVMMITPPTLSMRIQYSRQWNAAKNDFQPRRQAAEFLTSRGAKIEMERGEFAKLLGEPDKLALVPIVKQITLRDAIRSDDELVKMAPLVNSFDLTASVIDLEDAPIRGSGFRAWARAGDELRLSGTQLEDEGLRYLSRIFFITKLRLDRTRVTDDGMAWLPNYGQLHVLTLNHTTTTDKTLEHLAQGYRGANLLELEMDHTGVTDAGLKHLDKMKSLKRLSLRQTKVTADGVDSLRKLRPECQVQFETK